MHRDSLFVFTTAYFNFKVMELRATTMVLIDIKTAPAAGLNMIPMGASTPAARGRASILYPAPHHRFWIILRVVFFDSVKKCKISEGLLFTSTTSAESIATSVPAPIATPISARASAGASFTRRPPSLPFSHPADTIG